MMSSTYLNQSASCSGNRVRSSDSKHSIKMLARIHARGEPIATYTPDSWVTNDFGDLKKFDNPNMFVNRVFDKKFTNHETVVNENS